MRKLGRLPESAVLGIEHFQGGLLNGGNDAARNSPAAPGERLRLRNGVLQHLRLLHHVAVLLPVSIGDAQQHTPKAWAPVSIGRRKISAAVKWFAIGRQKRRERPTALPAYRADRSLVTDVDIGALIAIHFHGDEMLVHNSGHFGI